LGALLSLPKAVGSSLAAEPKTLSKSAKALGPAS